MTYLGRLTLIDWLCVDLCLIGFRNDSSFLCLAGILPLVGFRLYDATGIPALGSSVMPHPDDLEQSSQPARERLIEIPDPISGEQLIEIQDPISGERLIEIPDPISDDLCRTLKELHDEVKSKLVGSDGQLYDSNEAMSNGVYSLGEHLFAKDWDGDPSNLRSVLENLLKCPIMVDYINVPVTMLTRSNQNMRSFEREAAQRWLINRNQHPLTREPVFGVVVDECTDKIIELLLSHQNEARPPAQQSMSSPTDTLLAGN